jgi:hypothetical protein
MMLCYKLFEEYECSCPTPRVLSSFFQHDGQKNISDSDMSNNSFGGLRPSVEEVPASAAQLQATNNPIALSNVDPASNTLSAVPSMAGGRYLNMVGTYKDHILANAKFLYGPHETYDVVTGDHLEGEERAISFVA